jgi:hypothetical protein
MTSTTNLHDPATSTPPGQPLRCWLVALLSGWVTMVFASSALIVLRGVPNAMTRPGMGSPGPIAATWRVADEMGPAAKLLLVVLFAALMWLAERVRGQQAPAVPKSARQKQRWATYAVNIVLAIAAMLLTLAFVPANYSRGFGIGLTGVRFSVLALPVYVVSAALGALAYTVSLARCRSRR